MSDDEPIRVGLFPGLHNLPFFVARELGTFRERGTDVEAVPIGSSIEQFDRLRSGDCQVALTAFDNVLAYRLGDAEVDSNQLFDVRAFVAVDDGFLRLASRVPLERLGEARIGIDAPTTGYVLALREVLGRAGIDVADDLFIPAGGVLERFGQLVAGDIDATILVTPFDLLAEQTGIAIVQDVSETLTPFLGVVAAARGSWLAEQRASARAFAASLEAALSVLPTLPPDDLREIAIRNVPALPLEAVDAGIVRLLCREGGYRDGGGFDPVAVGRVAELRRRFAPPVGPGLGEDQAVETLADY